MKRAYHHGNLRAALLKAGLKDIQRAGLEATSMRQLARDLKVAPSAAYRHFKSKSDLVAAIGQEGFRLLGEQMQKESEKVAKANARELLQSLGRAYVKFAVKQPEHFRAMFDAKGSSNPETRPQNPAYQLLAFCIARLRSEGRIASNVKNPELAAWSMVHGLARLVIDGIYPTRTRAQLDSAIDTITQVVLDGLGTGTTQSR